jgi:hypothetical protein
MAALDLHPAIRQFIDAQVLGIRPPGHPEPAPDLGGVFVVHTHGVVGWGPSLGKPFSRSAITGNPGIHQDPLSSHRQLKTQRVGMGMARQIIRPDPPHIRQKQQRPGLDPHISGLRKMCHAWL